MAENNSVVSIFSLAVSLVLVFYAGYSCAKEKQDDLSSTPIPQATEKAPQDIMKFEPEYQNAYIGDRFFYNHDPNSFYAPKVKHNGKEFVIYLGERVIGVLERPRYIYLNGRRLLGKSYICTKVDRGLVFFAELE